MNRFWYKAVVFVLVLVALDFLAGAGLRYFYFKQRSGLLYRTTYAMEQADSKVLVFGSSRANHHYHPQVLGDAIGMSTYNTGRDGNFILYNTAVLKSILKRYTPEVVILDLDIYTFNTSPENYDRLSALLPYYKTHPEIRSIVQLRGPFEKAKLLSAVYPYNSMLLKIMMGNTELNKTRKQDIDGYVPLTGMQTKGPEQYNLTEKIDSQLVKAFETFITDAKTAGSKVYVIASPVHYQYKNTETLHLAKELCNKHQIAFWDYSLDSAFIQNAGLFADRAHLNDEGARRFSKLIAEKIKQSHL